MYVKSLSYPMPHIFKNISSHNFICHSSVVKISTPMMNEIKVMVWDNYTGYYPQKL
jgi:hypothetical protein